MDDILIIYNRLREKCNKERIGKKELATELNIVKTVKVLCVV